jgi:hypothetical protein
MDVWTYERDGEQVGRVVSAMGGHVADSGMVCARNQTAPTCELVFERAIVG